MDADPADQRHQSLKNSKQARNTAHFAPFHARLVQAVGQRHGKRIHGKTYTYKLSETNQGFAGMTYDTDVHEITVTVSLNENNELVAALTMDGKSVDALNATFENTYDTDTPAAPPTGDNSNLGFWIGLAAVALGGLVATVIIGFKRKKEDEDE